MGFPQRLLMPASCPVFTILWMLLLLPAAAIAQDVAVPCPAEPTDMTFSYGQMVRCRLDVAGDSDLFRFSGSVGEVIELLTMRTETTIVPCLELTAPNGGQTTSCGFSASNRISTTLTLTGIHTVRVRDFDFSRTGEYHLTLERIVPPSLSRGINYGETVSDALDLIGDLDLFTFNGTTGDDVTITVSRLATTLVPCLELGSPTGVRTTACGFSSTNQIRTTLSQTGIHTILVRDFDYSRLGGYTVTAQCLVGVCTSGLPPTTAADAYSTPVNTSLVIAAPGVLANDNSNGGGTMTAALVTAASSGSVALASNGGFTYTPNAGFTGTDSFSYRASNTNGPGNTATVTLTVTPLTPPTAVNDTFSGTVDTPLTVAAPGVLANDNTNGGGAMTAALVGSPSSGSLSLQTDGSFTYLPMSGFVGVDSFTYSAANTNGVSAPATVTIAIAATQNLLSNGSFEQGPAIPSGASYVTIPAGSSALTGWTVTGQNVDYIGPGWAVAHGVRAIDLDGDNALGGVQQGFSTIPGRTYVVSFALAGNPGGPPTIKQLRFSVDGQVHDLTFDSTGRSFPDLGWQRRSFVFVASGSTATVSFVSRSPARNSYGALIDDVVVVSQPPSAQPPTDLYAYAILGNLVTLRWTPPVLGPAPTGYVLEGGVTPGQVLASIPTGSPYPIYSFIAPTGSFYVRVHAATAAGRSAASNEIRIHVNVPVAPSPPSGLVGLVNGSTLDLAWRNTYAGGAASALMLDVTGSFTGSFTLGLTDHVAFGGVPGGTYTLRLRAINAGGASSASNPLTVTFPDVCTGAPATPSGFLVFRNFNQLTAIWDPAPVGPAPTGYVLDVSGAFTGSLQTAARSLGGTVAAGSYSLAVRATNACGSSPPTAAQVVTIP